MTPIILAATIVCAQMIAVDGDTLKGCGAHVRLFGINSPELSHNGRPEEPGAHEAKARMEQLTRGRVVRCEEAGNRRDRYGRMVAICGTASIPDLGAEMIGGGFACRWTRFDSGYYRGIGRECNRLGR